MVVSEQRTSACRYSFAVLFGEFTRTVKLQQGRTCPLLSITPSPSSLINLRLLPKMMSSLSGVFTTMSMVNMHILDALLVSIERAQKTRGARLQVLLFAGVDDCSSLPSTAAALPRWQLEKWHWSASLATSNLTKGIVRTIFRAYPTVVAFGV